MKLSWRVFFALNLLSTGIIMHIDLHLHTTASDGTLNPQALLDYVIQKGLRIISITDHDSIAGLREIALGEQRRGLEIVPGIELNTEQNMTEIHILGYFVNINSAPLARRLEELREDRVGRIKEIVQRIRALGMPIDFDEVLIHARGESVGRPHVARVLQQRGYVKEMQEAFEKYLKIGRKAYVPRPRFLPEEAINIVLDAGGIPVLAHPGCIPADESLIDSLVGSGLMGIEAYYPFHSLLQTDYYEKLAKTKKLHITGGSDFHGLESSHFKEVGIPGFPEHYFAELKKAAGMKEL
jgi:3',5'-nucleoside bisphosphate phosphatase